MTKPEYKQYADPPHLVAGRLIRLVEGLADVKFGADSRQEISAFVEGIYRMFWDELDKDSHQIGELLAMKERIEDRVIYIQRQKNHPQNQSAIRHSYAGEMTMAILALGYDPTKEEQKQHEQD